MDARSSHHRARGRRAWKEHNRLRVSVPPTGEGTVTVGRKRATSKRANEPELPLAAAQSAEGKRDCMQWWYRQKGTALCASRSRSARRSCAPAEDRAFNPHCRCSSWNALHTPRTLSVVLWTDGRRMGTILAPEESRRSCAFAAMPEGGRLRTQISLVRPLTVRRAGADHQQCVGQCTPGLNGRGSETHGRRP